MWEDTSFNNHYIYDSFGRLVQESNKTLDKTYVYKYNDSGNIFGFTTLAYTTNDVSSTEFDATHVYDGTIKDRLKSFNGSSISYDANGYPTYYNNKNYIWTKGKLSRIFRGNGSQYGSLYEYCNFAYDGYGRRTSKSYSYDPNPGSTNDYSYTYTTTYDYDTSGRLIHETCVEATTYTGGSSSTRDITYLYDETGIIGAIQKRGTIEETFYFDRNIKGDVIGIYNASGTKIANVSLHAWGNCTTKTLVSNSFSAYNPILYRGYYYDRETKLYYLNARYYDPAWRRFISPDHVSSLNPSSANGLNLYSYANNNPVSIAYSNSRITIYNNGGMVSSIGLSINEKTEFDGRIDEPLSPRNLPSVPGWIDAVSTAIDHSFSIINPLRTTYYISKYPNLWNLMRLDGVTELPGTLSKVATGIGWGLGIIGGAIEDYKKYASGASVISSIAGGLINAGISIGGMYAATKLASLAMGVMVAAELQAES